MIEIDMNDIRGGAIEHIDYDRKYFHLGEEKIDEKIGVENRSRKSLDKFRQISKKEEVPRLCVHTGLQCVDLKAFLGSSKDVEKKKRQAQAQLLQSANSLKF